MFILLKIGGTAWAGIAVVAIILILVAVGVIKKKMYPEKMHKPWKNM
jgi:uncharacterized membrane protein